MRSSQHTPELLERQWLLRVRKWCELMEKGPGPQHEQRKEARSEDATSFGSVATDSFIGC